MVDVVGRVGVIGATSFVGSCLLRFLTAAGWRVTGFSRRMFDGGSGVEWRQLPGVDAPPSSVVSPADGSVIEGWVCVAPIWALPDYFALLEAYGARRVVVLSSTSRFTKQDSSDPEEQALARRFADGEARLQAWAESHGVEWVVLRPTLIYGLGRDKNISEIARFIRRFGFFPRFGSAKGLRQPIHAEDVAAACVAALGAPCAANRAYNISGGETLSYREMVVRVFSALGRSPRFLPVPLVAFRVAVGALRCVPRYRKWSAAMAERMNRDMVFDHGDAERDLAFRPRQFVWLPKELERVE